MDQYMAVLVAELAASFINFFNYCSPYSGCYGAGKDNRGTDNLSGPHPIWTIGAPSSITPHFYAEHPFCCNPPNLSWLGTGTENNAALHTWWLGLKTITAHK